MAVAPGEHLDRDRGAAEADAGAGGRVRLLDQALQHQRASGREQHHRDQQVGAAAIVLFRHRSDVLDALLVGGDRLVLDPVVGGEVAVHQRHRRRHRADHLGEALAQRRCPRPLAQQPGRHQSRARGGDHPPILEGEAGGRQPPPRQRQHRHRLRQFQRPAQAGEARHQLGSELRLALGGNFDLTVAVAHRRRPVGRPVDQQPVAQRHPPQSQPLSVLRSHAVTLGDGVSELRVRMGAFKSDTPPRGDRHPVPGRTEGAESSPTRRPLPPVLSPHRKPPVQASGGYVGSPWL